jgi:biotin carboxylase
VAEGGQTRPADAAPKLAFFYHPLSFAPMSIVEAARGLCDIVWLVDTEDPRHGSTLRLLSRLGTVIDVAGLSAEAVAALIAAANGVDGVLTLADEYLEWTAALAVELGLPFLSPEAAHRAADKFAQRSALRSAGLPTPGCWAVNSDADAQTWQQLEDDVVFPAVIKPRHGSGSRNTQIVHSAAEARSFVDEYSGIDRQDWVLEEYIADIDHPVCGDGFANYVSVESVLVNGVVSNLVVTGRTPQAYPFRETGLFIPAAVDVTVASEVADMADRAILALGATIGCFHTEVKLTPAGPVIIEVNCRIGGGIPSLLDLTTGFDILRLAIRIALGEDLTVAPLDVRGVSYMFWVQAPEDISRVTAIHGLAEFGAVTGVKEIAVNRGPGDAVDWHDGNNGFVFSALGLADDHDGLRGILDTVSSLVRIEGD